MLIQKITKYDCGGVAGFCRAFCVHQLKTVISVMMSRELTLRDMKTHRGDHYAMMMFHSTCHCLQHLIGQTPDHSATG